MKWPMTIKKMLHNVSYFWNTKKVYVRLSFKIMAHLTFWRVFLGYFIKHMSEECFLYFYIIYVCSSRLSYQLLSSEIKKISNFVIVLSSLYNYYTFLSISHVIVVIKSKSQKSSKCTILESIYCSPFLLFLSVVTMLFYDYF